MAKSTGSKAMQKAAAQRAAGRKTRKRSWSTHITLVLLAFGAQFAYMRWWRSQWPFAGSATTSFGEGVQSGRRTTEEQPVENLTPSTCPLDWDACPRVGGINWPVALAAEVEVDEAELRECNAAALLSPEAVPGMHLLCVLSPVPSSRSDLVATIAVFQSMERIPSSSPRPTALIGVPVELSSLPQLMALIEYRLRLPPRTGNYQPRAIFTDMGIRFKTLGRVLRTRPQRLVLIEGGQWLWPPVEVGHAHLIPDLVAPGQTTRVVTRSLKPLVVEVEDFLTSDEAAHIIERASPHMAKSGVALKDADKGKAAKEFRTSSQYFLPTTNDEILERIDRRVSFLTRIPISHAEYIQVLRYNHLEHYSSHHDFFDPAAYASNKQMLESVEYGAKNRLATVFFYLNNVSAGGQTNFPRAATREFPHGGPVPRDYFDCSQGLSVFPQSGKVIIFYSLLPSGAQDDLSLHGGCDVLDETATKWSANFWLWNKPYHFLSPARMRFVNELERQYL